MVSAAAFLVDELVLSLYSSLVVCLRCCRLHLVMCPQNGNVYIEVLVHEDSIFSSKFGEYIGQSALSSHERGEPIAFISENNLQVILMNTFADSFCLATYLLPCLAGCRFCFSNSAAFFFWFCNTCAKLI